MALCKEVLREYDYIKRIIYGIRRVQPLEANILLEVIQPTEFFISGLALLLPEFSRVPILPASCSRAILF